MYAQHISKPRISLLNKDSGLWNKNIAMLTEKEKKYNLHVYTILKGPSLFIY